MSPEYWIVVAKGEVSEFLSMKEAQEHVKGLSDKGEDLDMVEVIRGRLMRISERKLIKFEEYES